MPVLRWKPLKSSVQKARALTGALEAINVIISVLIILLGVVVLFSGAVIPAFSIIILAVLSYFLFKVGYIALELLTEIADDTRLQLLAAAGEEYDYKIASQEKVEDEPDKIDLDEGEQRGVFNDAVAGYKRDGCVNEPSFENSTVYNWKQVILRDGDNKRIILMVRYDGQWIRE